MKSLDKLTDKLTESLLNYIRKKNGRGRLCRLLGVDDDFMISLKLSDLKSGKSKSVCIPTYGPIIMIEYEYLDEILRLHNLVCDVADQLIPTRCKYCIFGYYDECRAPPTLDESQCNFYNEEGEEKHILFMNPLSLIRLERMLGLRINQSLFMTSYIKYSMACLSVKR